MNPLSETEGLGPGGELTSLVKAMQNQRTHPAGFSPPKSGPKAVEDQEAKPCLCCGPEARNIEAHWRVPAGCERSAKPLVPFVVKGVSAGDGAELTARGRTERSWRLKRSSKEGEPSSIDEKWPSESLSRSMFSSVGWAVAEAALVRSLRQEDLPGRMGIARPARLAWLLRADFRRVINCWREPHTDRLSAWRRKRRTSLDSEDNWWTETGHFEARGRAIGRKTSEQKFTPFNSEQTIA